MSRSRKKPIIKDRPRNYKKSTIYWRRIRKVINSVLKSKELDLDIQFPLAKEIYNDYDYCDYRFVFRNNNEYFEKAQRK